MPWMPELFSTPVLERIVEQRRRERVLAVPFFDGLQAGEWLQQATLAIRAHVPIEVLSDTIQPFPTFSEIYVAALKTLRGEITAAGPAAGGGGGDGAR